MIIRSNLLLLRSSLLLALLGSGLLLRSSICRLGRRHFTGSLHLLVDRLGHQDHLLQVLRRVLLLQLDHQLHPGIERALLLGAAIHRFLIARGH